MIVRANHVDQLRCLEAGTANSAAFSPTRMENSGWPNSMGWPLVTRHFTISPDGVGLDLVHQLHGFDDADHLALFHVVAGRDKGRRAGRRRTIEGADDGRLDDVQSGVRDRPRPARLPAAAAGGCCGRVLPERHAEPRARQIGDAGGGLPALNLRRIFRSPRSRSNSATWYCLRNSISCFRSFMSCGFIRSLTLSRTR